MINPEYEFNELVQIKDDKVINLKFNNHSNNEFDSTVHIIDKK